MLKEVVIDEFLEKINSFDFIIDARSPKEYNESCIQTSINLYALNDEQHHEVGLKYKQVSTKIAKIIGAKYVCLNMVRHIEFIEQNYEVGSKVDIYCARGGMRSSSIATILSSIGFRVYKLVGGYKSYRQSVLKYFENFSYDKFLVLHGYTGCGKTKIVEKFNLQKINLEKIANHLGSSFGGVKGVQPSQKMFENMLFHKFNLLNMSEYTLVEGESKRIGKVILPGKLYDMMQKGKNVLVTQNLDARVNIINEDYQNIDDEFFFNAIKIISPYISKNIKNIIIDDYKNKDIKLVIKNLLINYYDKVYKKSNEFNFELKNSNIEDSIEKLNTIYHEISNTYK